jgi:GTP-binding protein EngB required for normal cell division
MSEEVAEDLNLFTVLEQGDRKIDTLKDNVIMMVGRTRAGKSCTFNWILNRDMIGEGD